MPAEHPERDTPCKVATPKRDTPSEVADMNFPLTVVIERPRWPKPPMRATARIVDVLGDGESVVEVQSNALGRSGRACFDRDTGKGLRGRPGRPGARAPCVDATAWRLSPADHDRLYQPGLSEYVGRYEPPPPASTLALGSTTPSPQLSLSLAYRDPASWLRTHASELFECSHLRARIKPSLCCARQRGETRGDEWCSSGRCALGLEQLKRLGFLP